MFPPSTTTPACKPIIFVTPLTGKFEMSSPDTLRIELVASFVISGFYATIVTVPTEISSAGN